MLEVTVLCSKIANMGTQSAVWCDIQVVQFRVRQRQAYASLIL